MKIISRALDIAEEHFGENSIEYAQYNLDVGRRITRYAVTRKGKLYIDRGVKIIDEIADEISPEYGVAHFHKGRYELATKDYKNSIKHLNKALSAFSHGDSSVANALVARGYLVEAYQNIGEADLATEHCLEIGKASPERSSAELMPLYRKSPMYPSDMLRQRKNGWVELLFDVNEQGFTKNIRVTASSNDSFEKTAKESASEYRYAPRFVNGEAVYSEDIAVRIVYEQSR